MNEQLPDNTKIPEWVNWIAQDLDGSWWGFSVEPLEHSSGWYENEVGDYILLFKPQNNQNQKNQNQNNKNWKKTLTKVNR